MTQRLTLLAIMAAFMAMFGMGVSASEAHLQKGSELHTASTIPEDIRLAADRRKQVDANTPFMKYRQSMSKDLLTDDKWPESMADRHKSIAYSPISSVMGDPWPIRFTHLLKYMRDKNWKRWTLWVKDQQEISQIEKSAKPNMSRIIMKALGSPGGMLGAAILLVAGSLLFACSRIKLGATLIILSILMQFAPILRLLTAWWT